MHLQVNIRLSKTAQSQQHRHCSTIASIESSFWCWTILEQPLDPYLTITWLWCSHITCACLKIQWDDYSSIFCMTFGRLYQTFTRLHLTFHFYRVGPRIIHTKVCSGEGWSCPDRFWQFWSILSGFLKWHPKFLRICPDRSNSPAKSLKNRKKPPNSYGLTANAPLLVSATLQ